MSTSSKETLSDIARIAADRHGGGGRKIGRAAEAAGHTMAYTTFDRILAGDYRSRPRQKTLEALAYLAAVPLERVYKAAGQSLPTTRFADQLPPDVDQLNGDQREALIYAARAFLKSNREVERLQNELDELKQQTSAPDNVHQLRQRENAQPEQKTGLAALERGLGEGIGPDATLEDS